MEHLRVLRRSLVESLTGLAVAAVLSAAMADVSARRQSRSRTAPSRVSRSTVAARREGRNTGDIGSAKPALGRLQLDCREQPTSTAVLPAPSHRADIQGLRAVAVLLVALGHAGVGFVSGGFVGVDVFFVLSGFLITSLLLAEARTHGRVSLLEFYLRRARRIVPAASLTLLVTTLAAFLLLNFVRAREAVHDSLQAGAFAANFRFAARGVDYFAANDPPSPVLHYWSLSVEEQFYFVWPLLLAITLFGVPVWRRRHGVDWRVRRLLIVVLVLTTASLAWSVHLTSTSPTAAYFSPFTRAWELGLGAMIAVCASALGRIPAAARGVMGWAGVTAIAVAALTFSEATPFPGSAGLLPTAGTALAIIAGMGSRTPRLAVGRLLALRPMLIVGDRSYALYLWHWPVLILADAYAGRELPVSAKLGLVLGAFLLSCVSYALVENPVRRRARSGKATVLVAAACTAALLGTAGVALAGIDRAQQRFEGPISAGTPIAAVELGSLASNGVKGALPAVVAAVEAARRGEPIPSGLTPRLGQLGGLPPAYAQPSKCIGQDGRSKSTTPICRIGERSSRKLIVLMGDSHAMMWLPALLEMARHDHWAVVPFLRLGCTPGKWTTNYGRKGCRDWYRWAIREIKRLRPRVTVIGGSIDQRPTAITRAAIEGVLAAAKELKASGRVVVIGDPEGLNRDPVDCVLSRNASMASCTTTWPTRSLAFYDEVARRARHPGAGFLDTRGFVCFKRRCPAVIGRTIAWADTNHMSAAYSAQLWVAFRAALMRAIPKTRSARP
jgi:peptidoglycan/LPS O-acetylase OafA/YrhL